MSVENSKLNDNILKEDQLEKVNGGYNDAEQRMMEHQQAVQDEYERRWQEEAERKKELEEEQKRKYIENQQRMKDLWYSQAR